MPFTQVQQQHKQPPNVRIFLTGQLMLQPDAESKSCEVFINRSASNHHLTIEVRQKRKGLPDEILMRHHGPLEFRGAEPVEGVLIRRDPPGSVSMYTGRPSPHGDALTCAIDLRSEGFHPSNPLLIDFGAARPSIMIEDGIFHTAAKTPSDLKLKLKKGVKGDERELEPFAKIIGVNIYLNADEFLNMAWREMGLPRTLSLTKPEDGSSYEIYIINDPLFQDPDEPKSHDELAEYYKVLPTVRTEDRLKMEIAFPEVTTLEKGTSRTPCMPVIVGGP